ncbi:hypothetical protein FVA81_03340 (plasmid) [Rhizobium sp. WL3]|uniref:hypothetical protein n=1 Tax=Rhizobium sp. WL3 TaxID=2603277 RepID=UPI0011C20439|nr:hypothetical protein [Rhizobium sp. WL3]QEE43670.1 hypothetical protein FVA81_03340 [Rhizobium sp. WL3]
MDALQANGKKLVVVKLTAGTWGDYRQALSRKSNAHVLKVAPYSVDSPEVLRVLDRLRGFTQVVKGEGLAVAWAIWVEYSARRVAAMLALSHEGARLMKAINARAVLGFEANSWPGAALNEAGGNVGATRIILNHNSQPPSDSSLANAVLSTLFEHRTYNSLVDVAGIWSREGLEWQKTLRSGEVVTKCHAVKVGYPAPPRKVASVRPFRILHAGNYQNWSEFFPWIAETSEEFLTGMEHLANAARTVEDIELVFRIRPKQEVDADTLRSRVTVSANVRIEDTEQDFLEQLSECDLMIAHFSTTVEQALQLGKPVLLWGNTQRYRQFEARDALPDLHSRAAVYSAKNAAQLPAMLAAIRDCHAGLPLTESELARYRHFSGTPDLTTWTLEVLKPHFGRS